MVAVVDRIAPVRPQASERTLEVPDRALEVSDRAPVVEVPQRRVVDGARALPSDPAEQRARVVDRLVAEAAGDRAALEAQRIRLLEQMHLPGDRSVAAARLRVVDDVLAKIPRPVDHRWRWQQEARRRRWRG